MKKKTDTETRDKERGITNEGKRGGGKGGNPGENGI